MSDIDSDDHDEQTMDEKTPEEDTPDAEASGEQREARIQKPRRNNFRKAGPKLTPEAAARQGAVTTLAFKVLGRDRAIAFLNGHHEDLAGRPIDIVVESSEGASRVTAAIEAAREG